ncbi:MAG: DUF167 domain-containing protein [Chitinophagales bacterium]
MKVKPNSRVDEISRDAAGELLVKVKAPAVDGKANAHLVEFLAKFLSLSKSNIRLQKGSTARFKTLEIDAEETAVSLKLPR